MCSRHQPENGADSATRACPPHRSYQPQLKGQEAECLGCAKPIIFDGDRWTWLYELGPAKLRKLRNILMVDRITSNYP